MFQRLLCPLKLLYPLLLELFFHSGQPCWRKKVFRNISYTEVIKVILVSFSNHGNTEVSLFAVNLFTLLRFCRQKFIA